MDANLCDDDAIVGAEDAAAGVRRRVGERAEDVGGDDAGRSHADACREITTGHAVLIDGISCHANLLESRRGGKAPDRRMLARAGPDSRIR